MNSFPDTSKESVKSQIISKSLYKKKKLLVVSNLRRSFMPNKLEDDLTQPAQRHYKDVAETSYFWSKRRLRLV